MPRKTPAMTEAHYQAHLEWAHAYENWEQDGGGEYFFQTKVLLHNFNKAVREGYGVNLGKN
uniref:Uncharacterized protein n=1 Tax=Rhizophagus irregularis (strain DAOM 181602 / DAOM 197198 / MUCL 43194) TaxID=747089 RepID=U9SXV7_RHIID